VVRLAGIEPATFSFGGQKRQIFAPLAQLLNMHNMPDSID